MIAFFNTIKLITVICSTIILLAGYCKADNSKLDCIIAPKKNVQGINSRKISVVNKCAKNYENKEIIEKCEILINRNEIFDMKLYQPVVSNITNNTYWNVYCATCNNDTVPLFPRFYSWDRHVIDYDRCIDFKRRIQKSEVDDIYNLTQMFIREGVQLIADHLDDTQLECPMNGRWPFHLIFYVIPCLYDNLLTGLETRLEQCQYAEKSGKICSRMRIYMDGLIFYFKNKNKEIYYNDTLSEYKDFTPGQYYVETEYPGVFFICDLPASIYMGKHSVKISIVVISLIFIVINLGINSNKRYFQQNKTNKLLYLYMVGLIPISIIFLIIYLSHPVPCVAYHLAKFSWAYHFFWSMFIFIEFCFLVCCKLHNRIVSGLRFLIYCIFGFGIPLALPIIYYFGVLVLNENYKEDLSQPGPYSYALEYTCPIIPNHLGVSCTSYEKFGSRYYELWLGNFISPSFYFFIPALFILIAVVVLCYYLNYSSSDASLIPYRDYLIVLTKMGSIMGIHWILFIIYQNFGKDHSLVILGLSFDTICQISVDFHGAIVFIVFGASTCIGFIRNMCGCEYKSVSQKDGNDDMEIS